MASLGLPTPTPYPNEAVQPQAVAEGESIVGESNDEIASLRQSFDAYAQWIAQYLQEQASASASSATLVDLHEKETDSTSPSDLILDIHMATIARNKLHYIKLASDASRELAKRMREAEAMRPMAPLSPTSPPAFWPSSLVENYCQTLRSCTEALSSALEAQQAASYYQLSPSASSSDNAHAATFTHLSQISSSLEQRLHHDRYALYLMMTNDVQEALEACSWPPPLTSNSSSSSTSSTLLSSAGEPAQPIHPSHPLVTSFSLQAEEDQYKVQRLNALMACLNGLQMVCEAEQFRALFSFNNNSGTTPIDPQSAVAAGDESSAAKGLPDEPMLWSMLQVRSSHSI